MIVSDEIEDFKMGILNSFVIIVLVLLGSRSHAEIQPIQFHISHSQYETAEAAILQISG